MPTPGIRGRSALTGRRPGLRLSSGQAGMSAIFVNGNDVYYITGIAGFNRFLFSGNCALAAKPQMFLLQDFAPSGARRLKAQTSMEVVMKKVQSASSALRACGTALRLAREPVETVCVAASGRSAGKTYEEAVEGRWMMPKPIPSGIRALTVRDTEAELDDIASQVDFVFCAVNMKKDELRALEERFARAECPVVSNNSAHRGTPDVPMIIPEINDGHLSVIPFQRKSLGTRRGFIAVKSNCSLQSYVPALHPLMRYGVEQVLACTYQAISGAGKTFATWPEMQDNVIPFIGARKKNRAGAA